MYCIKWFIKPFRFYFSSADHQDVRQAIRDYPHLVEFIRDGL